jgi:hypothetical protein
MRRFATILLHAVLVPLVASACGDVVIDHEGSATASGAGGGGGGPSQGTAAPHSTGAASSSGSSVTSPFGSTTASVGVGSGSGGDAPSACAGAPACTTNLDCPPLGTACLTWACIEGCCSTFDAPASTACADHGGTVCDGGGNCIAG